MAFLQRVTVVVDDYDEAIAFFVDVLGFELVEDSPALSSAGESKRWVVVCPVGGETELLLARADGAEQAAAVGRQTGGRVAFFLRTENFDELYARMRTASVEFEGPVRSEPYGRVVIFRDVAGNRWDLLGSP